MMRRAAMLSLLTTACAANGGAPTPAPESPALCEEGSQACHGTRAAVCRGGQWVERACAARCVDGDCGECVEGERRCIDRQRVEICEQGEFVETPCDDGSCEEGVCRCAEGTTRCTADGQRQRCDAAGRWGDQPCPAEAPLCTPHGCLACEPGRTACLDDRHARKCLDTGVWNDIECPLGCDPELGRCTESPCESDRLRCAGRRAVQRCDAQRRWVEAFACGDGEACSEGECADQCAMAVSELAPSGCEFHIPTIYRWVNMSAQMPPSLVEVYLTNADPDFAAKATIVSRDATVTLEVPPEATMVFSQSDDVYTPVSFVDDDGVISIRSDRPLFALLHHWIPDNNSEYANSGDAAYVLPQHLLEGGAGRTHRVITRPVRTNHYLLTPPGNAHPGGFAVASTSDTEDTTLAIHLTGPTQEGPGMLSYPGGSTQHFVLAPRDVLFVTGRLPGEQCDVGTMPGTGTCDGSLAVDLTGTRIESSRPVAVYATGLSRVPWCLGCHVQTQFLEQLPPVALWRNHHVLAVRGIPSTDSGRDDDEEFRIVTHTAPNHVRIVMGDGVEFPVDLNTAGERFILDTTQAPFAPNKYFEVESDAPLLIARAYHTGTTTAELKGGSSTEFERPVPYWRERYAFYSPGRANNRVQAILPSGATLVVDDSGPIRGTAIWPGSAFEIAVVDVSEGPHRAWATAPFSMLAYGYANERSGDPVRVRAWNAYGYFGPLGFGDALPSGMGAGASP